MSYTNLERNGEGVSGSAHACEKRSLKRCYFMLIIIHADQECFGTLEESQGTPESAINISRTHECNNSTSSATSLKQRLSRTHNSNSENISNHM